MFRFEFPEAFYLLLLIPAWYLFNYLTTRERNRRRAELGVPATILKLAFQLPQTRVLSLFFITGVLFLSVALANPQWGVKKERMPLERSDIFIALDISLSMDARDVSPSRLEKAKRFVSQLVNARKGDRIGLIFFAGSAFVQMPLTHDYAATDMFIRAAETGLAGTQGTVIGDAIQLAVQNTEDDIPGAMIIISDGEDHDNDALEAASEAARKGWQIFTVGVGTSEGGLIPVSQGGREEYKKDKTGQNVRSVPNTNLLKQLASQGNGQYFSMADDPVKVIKDVSSYLDMVKKRSAEVRSYTQYNSYFQYFLVPAFLCFLGLVLFPYGYFK